MGGPSLKRISLDYRPFEMGDAMREGMADLYNETALNAGSSEAILLMEERDCFVGQGRMP